MHVINFIMLRIVLWITFLLTVDLCAHSVLTKPSLVTLFLFVYVQAHFYVLLCVQVKTLTWRCMGRPEVSVKQTP